MDSALLIRHTINLPSRIQLLLPFPSQWGTRFISWHFSPSLCAGIRYDNFQKLLLLATVCVQWINNICEMNPKWLNGHSVFQITSPLNIIIDELPGHPGAQQQQPRPVQRSVWPVHAASLSDAQSCEGWMWCCIADIYRIKKKKNNCPGNNVTVNMWTANREKWCTLSNDGWNAHCGLTQLVPQLTALTFFEWRASHLCRLPRHLSLWDPVSYTEKNTLITEQSRLVRSVLIQCHRETGFVPICSDVCCPLQYINPSVLLW